VAEHEDPFARLVETLREPVRIDPGFTSRVMSAIAGEPVPADEASPAPRVHWLRRRWTIRLSPLGGLAVAAGLVGLVLAGSRLASSGGAAPAAGDTGGSARLTQFVLVAPRAASVTVVGDFNDWNLSATPLTRAKGDGLWWVTLPLAPGRYRYSFVVDGSTWLSDPDAPAGEAEFGRPNSVVTIGGD
jgi:hypothetical protein